MFAACSKMRAASGTESRRSLVACCRYLVYTSRRNGTDHRVRARIAKWGNSASVRIPSSVMAAAAFTLDQAVDIREEGGRVIIERVLPRRPDLDTLLDGLTPDTFHEEADFGAPVGHEVW